MWALGGTAVALCRTGLTRCARWWSAGSVARRWSAITLLAELYRARLHSVRDQTYCRMPPNSRLLGDFRRFSAVTSAAARKDPFRTTGATS